jgi:hypothetical protein
MVVFPTPGPPEITIILDSSAIPAQLCYEAWSIRDHPFGFSNRRDFYLDPRSATWRLFALDTTIDSDAVRYCALGCFPFKRILL